MKLIQLLFIALNLVVLVLIDNATIRYNLFAMLGITLALFVVKNIGNNEVVDDF